MGVSVLAMLWIAAAVATGFPGDAVATPAMLEACRSEGLITPAAFEQCLVVQLVGSVSVTGGVYQIEPAGPPACGLGDRALPDETDHPVCGSLTEGAPHLGSELRHALARGDQRRALGVAALMRSSDQRMHVDVANLLGLAMPAAIADAGTRCGAGTCFVVVADPSGRARVSWGAAVWEASDGRGYEAVVVVPDALPSSVAALGGMGLAGLVFEEGKLVAIGEATESFFGPWRE